MIKDSEWLFTVKLRIANPSRCSVKKVLDYIGLVVGNAYNLKIIGFLYPAILNGNFRWKPYVKGRNTYMYRHSCLLV